MKLKKLGRTIVIVLGLSSAKLLVDGLIIVQHDDKEYLTSLRHTLKKNGINMTEIYDVKEVPQNDEYLVNAEYTNKYIMRSYKHKFMRVYARMLYNRAKIKRKWLHRMEPLHLAIWYMECGAIIYKKYQDRIHTINLALKTYLDQPLNQTIIEFFDEMWNIQFFQKKITENQYILCCNLYNAKKFLNIVRPFICDSMKFKLNIDRPK